MGPLGKANPYSPAPQTHSFTPSCVTNGGTDTPARRPSSWMTSAKDHECLQQQLKIWADHHSCILETKGGALTSMYETFIVTSQYSIDEIFSDPCTREALHRRYKVVHMLDKNLNLGKSHLEAIATQRPSWNARNLTPNDFNLGKANPHEQEDEQSEA